MSVKPTEFHKKTDKTRRKPIPEYEPITREEEEATVSEACCVCDNPNNTWCYAESPNGAGAIMTHSAAQAVAFWLGR